MQSWRWSPPVGTGHNKAFEEGNFLTHWFLWQSFLALIKDYCYTCYACLPLSFGYWFCVPHMAPSSSVRIQLPAATTKCSGVSFIWENGRSVKDVFTLRNTAVLLDMLSLTSTDGRMTGGKTLWSGLVSRAVLASYKSCSVLGVNAQTLLLQVQHWFGLMPRYCVSDLRKWNITH